MLRTPTKRAAPMIDQTIGKVSRPGENRDPEDLRQVQVACEPHTQQRADETERDRAEAPRVLVTRKARAYRARRRPEMMRPRRRRRGEGHAGESITPGAIAQATATR